MNKTEIPISLPEIKIAPIESSDGESDVSAVINFDNRSDFFLSTKHCALAVCMEFYNERMFCEQTTDIEIRRQITIMMVDACNDNIIGNRTITVCLTKGQTVREEEVYIRFNPTKINTEHRYKVTVRDEISREVLGEKTFRFYQQLHCCYAPSELFEVIEASLFDYSCNHSYRSIARETTGTFAIRFYINPRVDEPFSDFPEVEIRAYFQHGGMEQWYTNVRHDYTDIFAEIPFCPHAKQRGITYVEIRCLGEPFGGMVLDTDGDIVHGSWEGFDTLPLYEYSYYDAAQRFFDNIKNHEPASDSDADQTKESDEEDCGCTMSDEELDRRIDEFISSELNAAQPYEESDEKQPSLAEMMSGLTGLSGVKERLSTYEKVVRFNKLREESGLPALSMPLHAMFLGSPGTGKTTVAKLMGKMLAAAGVLSKGHVVVRERATLLGQYYNSEASKTQEAIEEAQGGILLIDEAYQLYQPNDAKDPGKFVIESLLTALSDESNRDWMLILAGYPDEMIQMFDMNPGLKSRIPESNIYMFDDFSETELMEIAEKYLKSHNYTLSDDARHALSSRLSSDYANRDKNFGNARHVINLIQSDIIPAMAVRVISEGTTASDSLSRIEANDIPAAMPPQKTARRRVGYC